MYGQQVADHTCLVAMCRVAVILVNREQRALCVHSLDGFLAHQETI